MNKFVKVSLVAALMASVSLPNYAVSQTIPVGMGGIGGGIGGMFGGKDATRAEQLAQIVIAKEQMEYLFQAVESLKLDAELMKVFQQMVGIQTTVEDVLAHEPPAELTHIVPNGDTMNPLEHQRLVKERNAYLAEIDAEFAAIKKDVALNPNQFEALKSASAIVNEPRSGTVATQAQFVADQAAEEQRRREMAIALIDERHEEIKQQLLMADKSSRDAVRKCIREKATINNC